MKLLPEFFRRLDERPDELFYRTPRFGSHLDEPASAYVRQLYRELLPAGGRVLDFMAGCCSHLPDTVGPVTGLGLNGAELAHNPQLDDVVLFDVNVGNPLPFEDATFDAVVCTASVQYLVMPLYTFSELARILKPGGPLVVTFSQRHFPSKAVLAWRASDDAAHLRLVTEYYMQVPLFGPTQNRCHRLEQGEPVFAVWAYRH